MHVRLPHERGAGATPRSACPEVRTVQTSSAVTAIPLPQRLQTLLLRMTNNLKRPSFALHRVA